jgi:hypothetical protein
MSAHNFSESGEHAMLQADIVALEHRQQDLESEIFETLCHAAIDDPMIIDLRSKVLFIREEIDRLRHEALLFYHERYGFS